jgi:hypothetical protein
MWVLATRSRPRSCERFIQAWKTTQATSPVYVRLDDCDPELQSILELPWPDDFVLEIGIRRGLSASMNELFEQYPDELWYGMLADDLLPQTVGWDQALIDACGAWNISYANDLGARDWPTHPCVGGDLVRAIGWFGFPPCRHYFTDTVWKYLGEHLNNIHRLDHVVVEHLHYSVGKSEHDTVYEQSNIHWRHDKQAYAQWCRDQGPELVERLRCSL